MGCCWYLLQIAVFTGVGGWLIASHATTNGLVAGVAGALAAKGVTVVLAELPRLVARVQQVSVRNQGQTRPDRLPPCPVAPTSQSNPPEPPVIEGHLIERISADH